MGMQVPFRHSTSGVCTEMRGSHVRQTEGRWPEVVHLAQLPLTHTRFMGAAAHDNGMKASYLHCTSGVCTETRSSCVRQVGMRLGVTGGASRQRVCPRNSLHESGCT